MLFHALISLFAVATAEPETLLVPLPEVVVTPTRGAEEAGKVPAAISVVPKSRFASARQISLADALQGVPGTFVQSRSGGQDVRITIRGFGARGNGERSNTGNMRGIRVLTDGISITEPDGRTSLDYADLTGIDRIEVTRSNVSTLYGNASGGVVNMRTNLAFDDPYGEASGRAGSFGFHREQGAGGFAVGQGRGVLVLTNTTFDGWRDHSSASSTQTRLRFTTPLDERSTLGVLLDGAWNINRYPGALTRAELDSAPEQANPANVARDERRYNRLGRAALTFDRTIGEAGALATNLFVEPKVLQRSERNRFRDFTRYHVGGSANGSFLLANTPAFQARTLVGADDAYQDGAILFYNLAGTGRGPTLMDNKGEGASNFGVFVQDELTPGGRLSLLLGARYDAVAYNYRSFLPNPPVSSDHRNFSRVSPKLGVSWLMKLLRNLTKNLRL